MAVARKGLEVGVRNSHIHDRINASYRTWDGGLQAHFFIGVDPTEKIALLIEPSLHDMGFELVRVSIRGAGRPTLQIMAERADREPMTVEHCAEISRTVSALLDVEDPFPSAYELEVTSPGIDRPLVREGDFERFAGFEARIETHEPIDGRRRFRGQLLGIEGGEVTVRMADGQQRIPHRAIKKAKLVLTDELLAAAQADKRS